MLHHMRALGSQIYFEINIFPGCLVPGLCCFPGMCKVLSLAARRLVLIRRRVQKALLVLGGL